MFYLLNFVLWSWFNFHCLTLQNLQSTFSNCRLLSFFYFNFLTSIQVVIVMEKLFRRNMHFIELSLWIVDMSTKKILVVDDDLTPSKINEKKIVWETWVISVVTADSWRRGRANLEDMNILFHW